MEHVATTTAPVLRVHIPDAPVHVRILDAWQDGVLRQWSHYPRLGWVGVVRYDVGGTPQHGRFLEDDIRLPAAPDPDSAPTRAASAGS